MFGFVEMNDEIRESWAVCSSIMSKPQSAAI